jgi:RHS repeat-associated protein
MTSGFAGRKKTVQGKHVDIECAIRCNLRLPIPQKVFRKTSSEQESHPQRVPAMYQPINTPIEISCLFYCLAFLRRWICLGLCLTAAAAQAQWASPFHYTVPAGVSGGHPGTLTFTVSNGGYFNDNTNLHTFTQVFAPPTGPWEDYDGGGPVLTVYSVYTNQCPLPPPVDAYWTVSGHADDGTWYVNDSGMARGARTCPDDNMGPTPVFHVVGGAPPPLPTPTPSPETTDCEKQVGGDGGISCSSCGGGSELMGMAQYSVHAMLASLHLKDTPIRCLTPHGPSLGFTVTYNQRESQQPPTFRYSNLGPKWTFNWLSYVSDDPNSQLPAVGVYMPGGGGEFYSYNGTTQAFDRHPRSHALLVRTANGYERNLPDGSKQVYDLSDNAGNYPRRFFMTKFVDPTGDFVAVEYDNSSRVISIKDQLGQGVTLSYTLTSDYYKITKVTETFPTPPPMPRSATFEYTNGQLTKITDPIGIQSVFHYATGTDFMDSLQTPYGTTTFTTGQSSSTRWIQITDPMNGQERVEYLETTNAIGGSETVAPNATGITNSGLNLTNTFYWDKKAMADAPGDYTKARIIHWAKKADQSASGIVASEKAALENRVWHTYLGQSDSNHVGSSGNPIQTARVLDNANPTAYTQVSSYEYYDQTGNLKKSIDPKRRVTTYKYDDATQIDLLAVYQQNPSGVSTDPYGMEADKIAEYGRYTLHKPQDVFDAAHQKTVYTYTAYGQIDTVTNPRNEMTTYAYGDGSAGHPLGFLRSVTSPPFNDSSAVVSYTYDNVNRMYTVTNEADNYVITTDHDKLDRPLLITYSDTPQTTTEYTYTKFVDGVDTGIKVLEANRIKDRRGRFTYREYDGNRRPTKVIERIQNSPVVDRVTQFTWCNCGSLTTIIDPDTHPTNFLYDVQGRVYRKIFADNTTINYLYEGQATANAVGATSRLKSATDALNHRTNYRYAKDNDLTEVSYTDLSGEPLSPATPTTTFGYDTNYNRATSMDDGIGTTLYDYYAVTATPPLGAGRLKSVDGPLSLTTDKIIYSYDELGRMTSRSINGVATSTAYDSLGRLDTSDNVLGHFSRVYDGATHVTPRLKTLNYPNGQTANYTYFDNSKDRRLQTVQDLTSGSVNVSKFDYANYDAEGQIGDWTKTLGQSSAIASSHTYDLVDEVTNVTNTVSGGGPTSFTYTYDAAGNRLSDNTTNYTPNSLNQITNAGYVHDPNGNMVNDGMRGYEWDAANRLTAIVHPGGSGRTELAYDGLGRRVQMVEKDGAGAVLRASKFIWDGMTIAEERDNAGTTVVKRFLPQGVQVPANPSPNAKMFYSRDHLGSIRSLTNENGTILSTLDYDAYGGISRAPVPANPPTDGPALVSAVSRKTHGGAGTFDVNLPLSGAPGIEMRAGYGSYTLVLTFDRTVTSGSATIASGVGAAAAPTFSGSTATVQLSGVADRETIIVELDNISGGGKAATAKVLVAMGVLSGDVNQNGAVTIEDINLVYANSGAGVTASTFKYDVTFNGTINSSDVGQTQSSNGGSLFPDFAFTGHYYHARSGLYLAPYRAYNPTIGRWISRDPIGEQAGINLYVYVDNNPVDGVDPLGLQRAFPGSTRMPPIVPNPPGSNPNTQGGALSGAGGLYYNGLINLNLWLSIENGVNDCRRFPHSPTGLCKCCTVVLTGQVADGGLMNWTNGSGSVVDEPCSKVKERDARVGVWKRPAPTITDIKYFDW